MSLEPVIGIVFGVPAIGFAIRLVVKPIVDGYVRARELRAGAAAGVIAAPDPAQAQRILQLEAELASLREEVARLSAVESFYAQLQAPPGSPPAPPRS